MTAHSELVARLEGASEGSRVLDIAVRDFLLPDETALDFTMKIGFADQPWTHGERRIFVVENYTTSIDAALVLTSRVLPGWRCMVERDFDGAGWAMVQCAPESAKIMTDGNTPALALCIAILKATATQPDGEKT